MQVGDIKMEKKSEGELANPGLCVICCGASSLMDCISAVV